jgi:hypothetical protein
MSAIPAPNGSSVISELVGKEMSRRRMSKGASILNHLRFRSRSLFFCFF